MPWTLLFLLGCRTDPSPPAWDLVVAEDGPEGPRPVRVRVADGRAVPLPAPPGRVWPGPSSADGRRLSLVQAVGPEDAPAERLWVLDVGASAAAPAGEASGRVRSPAWLPDGRGLVHERSAGGDPDLWLVAPGQAPVRLTEAPWGSFEPSVSPDGRRVVYASSRTLDAELYVQPLEAGPAMPLVPAPGEDLHPVWSPTGERIAWMSVRSGALRAWIVGADGTDPHPVPHPSGGEHVDLAWSPDGRHLALVHQASPGHQGVVVVHADTGAEILRLDGPGHEEHPTFSPDGHHLACTVSDRDGAYVLVADLDTGRPRELRGARSWWLPRWVAATPP